MCVDGAEVDVALRADYIVQKEGKRYVAEVKTGDVAARIRAIATRRQLLEYRIAFDVDGVLPVDVEAGRVQVVTFPRLTVDAMATAEPRSLGALVIIVLVLVLAAMAVSLR